MSRAAWIAVPLLAWLVGCASGASVERLEAAADAAARSIDPTLPPSCETTEGAAGARATTVPELAVLVDEAGAALCVDTWAALRQEHPALVSRAPAGGRDAPVGPMTRLAANTAGEPSAPAELDHARGPGLSDPSPRPGADDPSPRPDADDPSPRPDADDPSPRPGADDPSPRPDADDPSPRPGVDPGRWPSTL